MGQWGSLVERGSWILGNIDMKSLLDSGIAWWLEQHSIMIKSPIYNAAALA